MKMKRTIKIALCAGVILAVAACFLLLRSKTVCGISEGTYRMVTEDGSGNAPASHFDMSGEKIRFVFGMDPRMSFAYTGTVQLDGKVRLRADNGGNVWIFQVPDNDTIVFVRSGSSDFMGEDLPDGAVFRYVSE